MVCLLTGWSWPELVATPEWVVEDVRTYLRKRGLVMKQMGVGSKE